MSKGRSLSMIFSLVLIITSIVCVALVCFISIKEYSENKIPKICYDEQIIKRINKDYSSYSFSDDSISDIEITKSDNNKGFIITVDADVKNDICIRKCSIKYECCMDDKDWQLIKKDFSDDNDKNFQLSGTTWSGTTEIGKEYQVLFATEKKAYINLPVQTEENKHNGHTIEHHQVIDNATIGNKNNDTLNNQECYLKKNEPGTDVLLSGSVTDENGKEIILKVTDDNVKLCFAGEGEEIILDKE